MLKLKANNSGFIGIIIIVGVIITLIIYLVIFVLNLIMVSPLIKEAKNRANRQSWSEKTYLNNKGDSTYIYFLGDEGLNQILSKFDFKDGKKHNLYIGNYPKSWNKYLVGMFSNGMKIGIWDSYHNDGKIKASWDCGDGSGDIVYKNDKVNAGSLDKDCNPINKFCPFCKSLIEIDNFKVKSDGIYRVGCIKCREYALNNMIFFDELDKYSSYEGSRKMMLEHKKRISIDEINEKVNEVLEKRKYCGQCNRYWDNIKLKDNKTILGLSYYEKEINQTIYPELYKKTPKVEKIIPICNSCIIKNKD